MEHFQTFHRISENPREYALQWKQEKNGKVIGHFCSYTPRELIAAAGALPYRIQGSGPGADHADSHLQAYCCSLVRGGLDDALAGRLHFLDGAVFPHTCDSIQRLSDIWRLNAGFPFHADMIMPVKLNTESAAGYMKAVLAGFRADLEQGLRVSITDPMLKEAVRTGNRVRRYLSRLYEVRRQNPLAVNGGDLHAVLEAAQVMDPGELAGALEALTAGLDPEAVSPFKGKRLVLSGGPCGMPHIHQMLEAAGGRVVWDDLCTGARSFEGPIDESLPPLEGLTRRYLQRVVCPAKHAGIYARGQYLLDRARENDAHGVIFLFLKFCDPHAFDYPYMKAMLDKAGIPSLMFELEDHFSSGEQLRTRCEAFLEML